MNTYCFWGQYVVKTVLAVLTIFLLQGYVYNLAETVAESNLAATSRAVDGTSPSVGDERLSGLPLLLGASSLIAAGAVSGFFRFQYSNIAVPRAPCSPWPVAVGHVTTFLQFVVIGLLLQTVVSCLKVHPGTASLGPAPECLVYALLLSMLCYDLYDFLVLWHRCNV